MAWFYADIHKTSNWSLIILHALLCLKITSEQNLDDPWYYKCKIEKNVPFIIVIS